MLHFSAFSLAFFCLAIVVSVFVLSSIFYRAPLILNASFGVFFIHLLVPSSSCGFVPVSIS